MNMCKIHCLTPTKKQSLLPSAKKSRQRKELPEWQKGYTKIIKNTLLDVLYIDILHEKQAIC